MRSSSLSRLLFMALLSLASLLLGCEPEPTASTFSDQVNDAGSVSADVISTLDGAQSGGAPYTGAWAMATDWSVCVTIGSRIETRSRKLLLVTMTRKGNRLIEERKVCQLKLTPIFGLKTEVPDVVLQSMPLLDVESRLLGEGSDEVAYSGGIEAQVIGVKMVNPVYDAMPSKDQPSDPRLTDPEGDGHPGASFVVGGGCYLYVAQREVSRLAGRLVSQDRFEGTGVHATEQVVFGASKAVCGQTYKTFSNTPHHHFVLQRVNTAAWDDDKDGDVTCAELVAHQADLITWAKPDDTRCPKVEP